MQDAWANWAGDLAIGPTGDLALAADGQLGQQRVLRRLLTNPGDNVWASAYGAGLAQAVGGKADADAITAAIRKQIFLESCVARSPEPTVAVSVAEDGSVFADVRYADALSGTSQILGFSLGG